MPLSDALHEAPGSLGTVRNAVVLLHLLAEGPAHQQLTDLGERSGLSLPTVHRLLRSLVLSGLVEQDPKTSRYGLGPELVRLADRYLARLPIAAALAPYLAQLRDATGATVRVDLLVRGSVVTIDRVDAPTAGLYRGAHQVRPALHTAAGRLLAARADDETWKLVLSDAQGAVALQAAGQRDDWAAAGQLLLSADPADPEAVADAELAVPVSGWPAVPAALVAELTSAQTGPAGEAERSRIAAHLSRAAGSAVRTLGHA